MEQKRKAIVISSFAVGLFVFVVIAFSYISLRDKIMGDRNEKTSEIIGELPRLECGERTDDEDYYKALEEKRLDLCGCVEDEMKNEQCQRTTKDLILYDQAVAQFDEGICTKIDEEEMREACVKVTTSGSKYLSEEDPQYLAELYLRAHSDDAIIVLEGLVSSDPNNSQNLRALAMAYAEKGLRVQEDGGDQKIMIDKAIETIERAKKIDPDNSEVYRVEGYIYEIMPDLSKSMEMYDMAIALDDTNVLVYIGRAHVYAMLGMNELAIADLRNAAALDSDQKQTAVYARLCNLASTNAELEEEAIKNCKIVITSQSNDHAANASAYQTLGMIYMHKGRLAEAENYLLQAMSLYVYEPTIYTTLGKVKIQQGDFEDARQYAQQAIDLNGGNADAYHVLATALLKQSKYQEAIIAAQNGLENVDQDVSLLDSQKMTVRKDLYYTLANIYYVSGDQANEMSYKQKAEQLMQNDN